MTILAKNNYDLNPIWVEGINGKKLTKEEIDSMNRCERLIHQLKQITIHKKKFTPTNLQLLALKICKPF